MITQQIQTLGAADKKVIFALLVHPRLIGIRRQFEHAVAEVLGDQRELESVAQATGMPVNELSGRARRMLLEVQTDQSCKTHLFGETAETALAFFTSPRLINLWGHFTMALQKITLDDLTIGEVAATCGPSNIDQVRRAIRRFSTDAENRTD